MHYSVINTLECSVITALESNLIIVLRQIYSHTLQIYSMFNNKVAGYDGR